LKPVEGFPERKIAGEPNVGRFPQQAYCGSGKPMTGNMTSVALKMLVVYSDRTSAEIGDAVAKHLSRSLGGEFEVVQTSWNTELLRNPKLRELAAQDALQSDIVIVSTSEARTVPAELNSWIEMWSGQRTEGPAALVALLGRNEMVRHRDDRVRRSLRQAARRAHMDFFCHTESVAPKSRSSKEKKIAYMDPSGRFKLSFLFK
jgi:hypothetical protein